MYFSEEDISEVIKQINIKDEIEKHVKLKQIDGIWLGICPFHKESTPSFIIDEQKQLYYCSGCGKGGNIVNFIMDYFHISFTEAFYQICGIKLQTDHQSYADRITVLKMNKIASELYQKELIKSTEAIDYIKERKLNAETLLKFKIGFAGSDKKILYKTLKLNGFSEQDMMISGLISFGDNGYVQDKFAKRLIFPILNLNDHTVGFGGRILTENTDKKMHTTIPKYLNSPETVLFDKSINLFGINVAKKSLADYFILCEGYMDVIAMHQAGFTSAVASLGTAFTQKQAELIKQFKSNVILAYDSDAAGIKAAKRAIPILHSCGISVKLLEMSPYKDPDEYIKKCGKDNFEKKCINMALAEEQWFFKRAFEEDDVNIIV